MNSSGDANNLTYGMIFREFKNKNPKIEISVLFIDHFANRLDFLALKMQLLFGKKWNEDSIQERGGI